eukprot:15813656-Heterocapsa_arctica.AAC.1
MRARHRDIVYGRSMTTCPAPTKRDIELMEQRNVERAAARAANDSAPDHFPNSLELYPRNHRLL